MSNQTSQTQAPADQGQAQATPQPGTPEYAAQMAALYDAQNGSTPAQGTQGTGTDQSQKATTESTDQVGDPQGTSTPSGEEQATPPEGEGGDKSGEEKPNEEKKDELPALGDFVMDPKVNEELYVQGQLSDKSLETLEKLGVPRDLAQRIAGALKAEHEVRTARIHEYAGGQQKFEELAEWGFKNLPAKEWNLLASQIEGDGYQAALDVLSARRSKALGDPQLHVVRGQGSSPGGYASQAEMVADMRNPRYETDPAFRAQVQEKLRNATF